MKKATSVEEQINLLKRRGLEIGDEDKAREQLLDIGYYRLGFYSFSFEQPSKSLKNRTHRFNPGVSFSDIIELYYFDVDLRNILIKYLNRIEVNLRTTITYLVSNKYVEDPIWFSDTKVVSKDFVDDFDKNCYNRIKESKVIIFHHRKYRNDRYAPAWKTLEFMTLGNLLVLYKSLRDIDVKSEISQKYGCEDIKAFENYFETIRVIRNACAHGACVYSLNLHQGIRLGPAFKVTSSNRNNICGVIQVVRFILGQISLNKRDELMSDLRQLFDNISSNLVREKIDSLVNMDEIFVWN